MAELHADQIASRDFPTSFRGFDQHEVRSFLGQVAAELAAANERERSLHARIAELESAPPPMLDESALERALGQEATRVIHAAREAATEIRERAEANAAAILAEANERNASARADAEAMASVMRAEVDEALQVLRADTERRATVIIEEAESKRDAVLKDLNRRRKQVLAQLEQLHAARATLEVAYANVRAALDAATAEVAIADDEAVAIASAAVAPAPPVPVSSGEESVELEMTGERDAVAAIVVEPVVEEPEPAPVVEIVPPPVEAPRDDRRSSSLRLLRPDDEVLDAPMLVPVVDAEPYEGVRIIRPEPAPAPTPDPEPEVDPEPAAVEPEPDPDPVAVAPEPDPDPDPVAVEPVPEADPAPVTVDADPDLAAEPAPVAVEPEQRSAPVEDLFARLRADRAEKTAAAVAVLTEPVVETAVEPVDDEPGDAPEGDAALLAARDAAIADIERGLVRSIKRALADEQNEVLDALRRLKGRPTVEAIMPDAAVHDARYEAVLSTAAAAAAEAGGAGDGRGVAAERGPAVAADLRLRVGRVVDDAGGDVDTLIEAISATYREWKTSRTEALARDVVTGAFASGAYAAGEGDLRWVVDPAEGGCPDCDDNVLAGPTPKGTAYPTGQLHPPAHTGCRCTVVPAG